MSGTDDLGTDERPFGSAPPPEDGRWVKVAAVGLYRHLQTYDRFTPGLAAEFVAGLRDAEPPPPDPPSEEVVARWNNIGRANRGAA